MSDIVRIIRIYEFVGDRALVEDQIRHSIHGERLIEQTRGPFAGQQCTIRAATLGTFPEILNEPQEQP